MIAENILSSLQNFFKIKEKHLGTFPPQVFLARYF